MDTTRPANQDFAEYALSRWPVLVRSAVLLGCAPSDAEDVAQTALLKTWRHWKRVRSAAEPDAYVFRILANALATSRRRRWWGEVPSEFPSDRGVSGQSDLSDTVAQRDAVVRALATLPADQRQVLVLRHIADLSERATAEALGVPAGTVKSRAARGIARLQSLLSTEDVS